MVERRTFTPLEIDDGVAQLVEHGTHKPGVVGSIPTSVTRSVKGSAVLTHGAWGVESRSMARNGGEGGGRALVQSIRVVTNPHLCHNKLLTGQVSLKHRSDSCRRHRKISKR